MKSFVYAFQVGDDGPIKIGVTAAPERRFAGISLAVPWPIARLLVIPGTRTNEAWVHARLNQWRLKGEWFANDDTVLRLIARLGDPSWIWPTVTKAHARPPRLKDSIAGELQDLVRRALGPVRPGEAIGKQIERVTERLGLSAKKWRVRAAWNGEASGWSAIFVDDFRRRCRALIENDEDQTKGRAA